MVTDERWLPVVGYEGLYEVSNLGRVKSLKRPRVHEHMVAQEINYRGYCRVNLWKNNRSTKHSVHRLVAQAFVANPHGKPQVNHIDEVKTNNRADNLEWCTQLENHNHGTINVRISKSLTNNTNTSKPVKALDDDGNCIARFPSIYEASRTTGINVSCIRDCLHKRNRTKHAGGYVWQYED